MYSHACTYNDETGRPNARQKYIVLTQQPVRVCWVGIFSMVDIHEVGLANNHAKCMYRLYLGSILCEINWKMQYTPGNRRVICHLTIVQHVQGSWREVVLNNRLTSSFHYGWPELCSSIKRLQTLSISSTNCRAVFKTHRLPHFSLS